MTLPPDFDPAAELALAQELADLGNAVAMPLYESREFSLDRKADRSEVTEADRNAELAISRRVLEARPHHGMYGEEHGVVGDASSPWRWVVDPIDGTSNFVRGIPVWATLVALTHADHGPVVGVVAAPAMGRRWWAARGLGAFANGRLTGAWKLTGRILDAQTGAQIATCTSEDITFAAARG